MNSRSYIKEHKKIFLHSGGKPVKAFCTENESSERLTLDEEKWVFIPFHSDYPRILEGYYTRSAYIELLRVNRFNPDAVHFLADMLEE